MNKRRNSLANLYNPKTQSPEELTEQFVVRQTIFKRLYREIQQSKMNTPEQHILVEGKRGMGKTTLLLRLAYEIERDAQLNQWLIPLVFNEEEYGVRKLFKMWERVLELLVEKAPEFAAVEEQMEKLSRQVSNDEDYEKALYKLLSETLHQGQQKIILFIDNFGDMFQKFNEREAHRLRKVLQTSADIRIIAASSVILEAFYEYKHPFYEFFKIEQLESLNTADTCDLLRKLGERFGQPRVQQILEHQPGRVEALRRLTGGVIRTIVLLFEIFVEGEDGNAFADLEAILDRVTPLYKHRMDDLPPQQQEIVEAIALHWDAIGVKEIAEKTRVESKIISAQLQQLVKSEIIHKIHTSTKNHLYQIKERFFNIWYLMRNGRINHRSKVLWLVRFLEEWCDEMAIVKRSRQHISSLQKGDVDQRSAFLLSQALAYSRHLPKEEQHQLLETTREYLQGKKSKYARRLAPSELDLQAQARQALRSKQYRKALPLLLRMKEPNNALIAFTYYHGFQDYKKAEQYYLAAARQNTPAAYNNLAIIYDYHLHQAQHAEQWYHKAIEHGQTAALFNLGLLYKNKLQDYPKAVLYYQKAIEEGDDDAAFNLANLYANELQQPQEAEQLYQKLAAYGNVRAMHNLAYLYLEELNQIQHAAYYFKMSIEQGLLYEQEVLDISEEYPIHIPFLFLMARSEYDYLYDFFQEEKAQALQLIDKLKPIYYTLLSFMQDRFPNGFLRMGPELEETVSEIIGEVNRMRTLFGK